MESKLIELLLFVIGVGCVAASSALPLPTQC